MEKSDRDYLFSLVKSDPNATIDSILKSAKYSTADPDAWFYLGVAYFKLEQLDVALRHFEKVLSMRGKDSSAWFYIGLIAEKQGRTEFAVVSMRNALAINASMSRAQTKLQNLEQAIQAREPLSWASHLRPQGAFTPTANASRDPDRHNDPYGSPGTSFNGHDNHSGGYDSKLATGAIGLPPRGPSTRHGVVGRARSVKTGNAPFNGQLGAQQMLSFRVDVPDSKGNLDRSIQVEMRGFRISGALENGDWVELDQISRSGSVKAFENLTTNQQVRTRLF